MKKIISMLCVVAMMLSFVAISANASGEKISLVANEAATTDEVLAFDVVVECAEGIKASTVQVKYDGFLTNNSEMTTADFSAVKVSGATANNVVAQKFITTNYTDTSASNTAVTLATIKVNKANFKNDAAFYFTANTQVNGVKSYATAGLEIEAPVVGGGEEEENTLAATGYGVVAANTIGGKATDWQVGAGLAMTVDNPTQATFTKMAWVLTTADGKLYGKPYEIGNINAAEFDVVATFVNNEKADPEAKIYDFSAFSALFLDDADAEWATNDITDVE